MGRCIIVVANELFARIRDPEGDIAKRVTVVERPVRWCERLTYAVIETPLLPEGLPWVQDIIVEDDGTIRFKRDVDV
jgi:hypothetical protein